MHRLMALLSGMWICIALAARAEPVALNVIHPENSIETSNHRLFVSSDGALYELRMGTVHWGKLPVPVHFRDGVARACYFLGIAEANGMLYTVCTEDANSPAAKKMLFALDLYQPVVQLNEVGELRDVALPNGLAADAAGNLYLADSGPPMRPGVIRKITLDGANEIATQTTVHRFVTGKPNGLRYAHGKLYVSVNPISAVGMSQLLRFDVGPTRLRRQKNIYNSLDLLDDFALVEGGIVLARFIGGNVVHVDEQGSELQHATFSQPTSVSLLTGAQYAPGSLLITERGSGRVQRFVNDWRLRPR